MHYIGAEVVSYIQDIFVAQLGLRQWFCEVNVYHLCYSALLLAEVTVLDSYIPLEPHFPHFVMTSFTEV